VIVSPPQDHAEEPPAADPLSNTAAEADSIVGGHTAVNQTSEALTLGIQDGGIQGAEALLLARYFMWAQVYLHHVRRAYDLHLKDFMLQWLRDKYPVDGAAHLRMTDSRVLTAIAEAATDSGSAGHNPARRIEQRDHFRRAYRLKRTDLSPDAGGHPDAPLLIEQALQEQFGSDAVSVDFVPPKGSKEEVYVLLEGGQVISGLAESDVLSNIPPAWCAYVFCTKELVPAVQNTLHANKSKILQTATPAEGTV
jgi:hypothetical protein